MRRRPQVESLEERAMLASDLYVVTSLLDTVDANDGVISLREAIAIAAGDDSTTDNDTIQFDASLFANGPGTLTLSYDGTDSGTAPDPLVINSEVSILGPVAEDLILDGSELTRVFVVNAGMNATISGLTITKGKVTGSLHGGGVYNSGYLVLDGVILFDNEAGGQGGAIYSASGSTLRLIDSTVSENTAAEAGGIKTRSSVENALIIENSAVINNTAGAIGGLFISGESAGTTKTAKIINSTFSGNSSTASHAGAILVNNGFNVTIVNSTITNNSAYVDGGGVRNSGSSITLYNTIVAGNTSSNIYTHDWYNSSAQPGSSNNLIGVNGSINLANNVNGNRVGTTTTPLNPGLAPLANNGGNTWTHALLSSSPAIDKGSNAQAVDAAGNPLTLDQRGLSRDVDSGVTGPSGGTVDIGAFEFAVPESLVVSTLADENDDGRYGPGDLSLREALTLANLNPGVDTITFTPGLFAAGPATITLTYDGPDSGSAPDQLTIDSDITIDGPGPNLLTISGDDQTRVFQVNSGVTATLRGTTIAEGIVTGTNHGGGLYNLGAVTLESVVMTDNHSADHGGAIFSWGTVHIIGSTISQNSAVTGGAISSRSDATNSVVIENSAIILNEATYAGGIRLDDISDISGPSAKIINSTFSGNTATGNAGAIQTTPFFTLEITNTTITANTSGGVGGGIRNSGGSIILYNTILAGNTGSTTATDDHAETSFSSLSSNNLIGPNVNISGGGIGNIKLATGQSPGLAPLDDYGGTKKTHALLATSPAIDKGSNAQALDAAGNPLTVDERGFARNVDVGATGPSGGTVDVGAFEFAFAGPIVVNTVVDENDGRYGEGDLSLREALALADLLPGVDTVTFDEGLFVNGPATITLTYDGSDAGTVPDQLLASNVIIQGPGADKLIISGGNQTRVIYGSNVTVEGATMTEGYAAVGGGIFGEAITLREARVTGNAATSGGGGIHAIGALHVIASEVSDNSAPKGAGISSERLYTNYNVAIENSTISGNHSLDPNGRGAGIFSYLYSDYGAGLDFTITNSTITGNSGVFSGGGIQTDQKYLDQGLKLPKVNNSIIAGNSKSNGDPSDVAGSGLDLTSSHNLIGQGGSGGLQDDVNGNIVLASNESAGLLPLDYYGGTTRTHALLPGSFAIDAGDDSKAVDANDDPLLYDQNGQGFDRILSGHVDIGASESHAVLTGTHLKVYGTDFADAITIRPDSVAIDRIGTFELDLSSVTDIVVDAFAGDDFVTIDTWFDVPATVYGREGNDTIQGGSGNDTLDGGADNDVIYGDAGDDHLLGGSGNDLLFGERGEDELEGGTDNDQLYGGDDDDILDGGDGDDILDGGPGEDATDGGIGNDLVDGARVGNRPPEIIWFGSPFFDLLADPSVELNGGELFDVQVRAFDPDGDYISYEVHTFVDSVEVFLPSPPSIDNQGRLTWSVAGQTTTDIENITLQVTVSDQPPGGGSGSNGGAGQSSAAIGAEVTPANSIPYASYDLEPLSPIFDNSFDLELEPGEIGRVLGPAIDSETGASLDYELLEGRGGIDGNEWTWDMSIGDFETSYKVVFKVSDSGNPQGGGNQKSAIGTFYIHPRANHVTENDFTLYAPPVAFDASYYVSAEDPLIDEQVSGNLAGQLIVPLFGDDNPSFYFPVEPPKYLLDGGKPDSAAEWDWDEATGQFSYTPKEDFSGVEEFQFTIINGPFNNGSPEDEEARESNVATVRLLVGSGVTVEFTPEDRPDDDPPPPCDSCSTPGQPQISGNVSSGGAHVTASMGGGAKANYRADSGPTMVRADVQVDSRFHTGSTSPDFHFTWFLNDVEQSTGYLDTSSVPKDEPGTFYFPLDNAKVASGYHLISGEMSLTGSNSGPHSNPAPAKTTTVSWIPIITQDDYGFGKGWNLAGIERIIAPPPELTISAENPIYWLRSDGYVLEFHSIGATAENDVDASVLSLDNGHFVVTDKHGAKSFFSADGWLTLREDRYGNGTLYVYDDVNNDEVYHEITEVIDQTTGHSTTFGYVNNGQELQPRVSTITDFAHRVTNIEVSGNDYGHRLNWIATPDQSTGTYFSYSSSGRLEQMVDGDGHITTYVYSPDGQTVTTTYWTPGGAQEVGKMTQTHTQVTPYDRVYLASGTSVSATAVPTEDLLEPEPIPSQIGSFTDELGRVTTYETGPDNYVSKMTDPSGRITQYERNAVGQLTSVTLFDTDGTTVLDHTTYTYDAQFNLTDVTYFDGSSVHQTYDSLSRSLTSTDELGRQTIYSYDDYSGFSNHGEQFVTVRQVVGLNDSISSEVDDLVTVYEYDPQGLLIRTTEKRIDPDDTVLDDVVTEYAYVEQAAPCGCGFTVGLWLDSITYAVGTDDQATVNVLEHDSAGNPIVVEDELGRDTIYRYDGVGRIILIVQPDPDGEGPELRPITQFVYSETGRLLEQIQTSGEDPDDEYTWSSEEIVTSLSYDARGRLEHRYDSSAHTEYDYDLAGNVTAMFDPLDRRTEYGYDALDRQISVKRPDPDGEGPQEAPVTFTSYDALGRMIAERDENGNITRYEYDARHRVTKIIAPLGATTQYFYDDAGQLTREIDPMGRATSYTYDTAGRLTSRLEPGAAAPTTYQYDTLGNLRFMTDPLGHTAERQYDARGRLIKEIDANDAETIYTYYDSGELHTLTDPVGNTTTRTYDAAGRVATETNELGDTRTYKYDAFGRVIQVTDRNERVTTYEYDDLNRLREETWYANQAALNAGQPLRFFQFDYAAGVDQLDAVWDFGPNGEYGYNFHYQFKYDNLGNVTQTYMNLEGLGLAEKVAFDSQFDAGRLTETSLRVGVAYYDYGAGGTADYVNQYSYDALGRLTRVTQAESTQAGHHEVAEKRVDFTYNKDSQASSVTRFANLAGTQLVASSSYGYDNRGRLSSLTHKKNSTVFAGYGFTYDDANRLTGFSNNAHTDENATYTYDDRGQLTYVDRPGIWYDETYYLDPNGNRLEDTDSIYDVDPNNRLSSDGDFFYQYDDEGNRTRRSEFGGYSQYTYDHRNRLVAVVSYDDNGTPTNEADDVVTKRVDYVYDAFNQLVKRVVDPDGDAGSADIDQTFYLYDQGQVALEFHREGSGNVTAGDLSHRYLWNPAAVDQLLADEQVDWSDSDADGEVLWGLGDHLGSVRDVVDSGGTVRIHRNFDSFGTVVGETHYNAIGTPVTAGQTGYVDEAFAFTGRYFDRSTGLQNNLNRWYDPNVGRWTSEDPIGFAAGDANLYRYVGNTPTMYVDPNGLITGSIGYAADGTVGILHLGCDVSLNVGFSFNSYPFFTIALTATGGAGLGVGAGVSTGPQAGGTSGVNTGVLQGPGAEAGVNTPWGSGNLVGSGDPCARDGFVGGTIGSPGFIADFHAHDTYTVPILTNGPTYGPGHEPDWVWPWDSEASWGLGDTWHQWFGGGDNE